MPTVTNVAPLFPHGGPLDDRPGRGNMRDKQIYPRYTRETDHHQQVHRNASVKHHLRATANRDEMRTTYEHDFGFATRPCQPSGARTPVHGLSATRPLGDDISKRQRTHALSQSMSSFDRDERGSIRSYGSRSSVGSAALHDPLAASQSRSFSSPNLWPSTEQKLKDMSYGNKPMRLACRGWGDTKWSQHSHPHMITGFSDKRVGLVQTANCMNLRAPDVPFSTR